MENLNEGYWKVAKAAKFLDVSKKRIYNLIQEGRLEVVRLSPRSIRIKKSSIINYVTHLKGYWEGFGDSDY